MEWTDHTFNPFIGCTKVSPGCDHCYAEAMMDTRLGRTQWGPQGKRVRTSASNWRKPLRWNKAHADFFAAHNRRQRVFCASLADVFDNAVDPAWRRDLFDLIELTPNLDWLLLTKRIGNVMRLLPSHDWCAGRDNVWLGATIVNQEEALRDVPKLMQVPARRRFLSVEPMLGPIDLTDVNYTHSPGYFGDAFQWHHLPYCNRAERYPSIDWVICGGESGPGARPMHPSWPRALRDQCATAGVPFFYKQWGEWTDKDWGEQPGYQDTAGVLPSGQFRLLSQGYVPPFDTHDRLVAAGNVRLDGRMLMHRVGKENAGRLLDGRTHDEFPHGSM
ncbi:phage Gp37/Gp68 family protein [Paraburkholderia sp. BR14263]|uniref:phage Gp37/Gp68 family protein n=1 Tax=unclassified Paraburkholderia TaxID=2615204 RepID=UPI0034CD722F